MTSLVASTAILVVFLVFYVPNNLVSGECCSADRNCHMTFLIGTRCIDCADGTHSTPFCGYGGCNIFGCNCEGGCRVAKGKRAVLQEDKEVRLKKEHERIAAHSKSHVDQLDITEAYELVKNTTDGAKYNGKLEDFSPIFKKADKDGNGKLTFEEIDELKP